MLSVEQLCNTTKEGDILDVGIADNSNQGTHSRIKAEAPHSLVKGHVDNCCTLEPQTHVHTIAENEYRSYRSPASDYCPHETSAFNVAKTSLLCHNNVSEPSESIEDAQTVSLTNDVTPSMVHYKPYGIPNMKARKQLASGICKPRNRGSSRLKTSKGEAEIRFVQWDRTDKGTAPLKLEPRPTGPRACTLCSLTKRKCDRTDGQRPNTTRPCAACQNNNFVCQFISPSQLGGTERPTLESLKLHTDQAQRLRTIELENKIVKLEHALEMQRMENRVQIGYITNLKLYDGITNGYILQLKERLEELDPGSQLLKYRIPAAEQEQLSMASERERSPEHDFALSDLVEGIPVVEMMNLDSPDFS